MTSLGLFGRILGTGLALAALGCTAPPVLPQPEALDTTKSLTATLALNPASLLSGHVRLPVRLVGAGHVIPTGIGNVIPVGIGNVIPTGVGNYKLKAIDGNVASAAILPEAEAESLMDELPVVGATVVLRDPLTRKLLPGLGAQTTDGSGHFTFASGTALGVVLVEVSFLTPDGRSAVRLLALAQAQSQAVAGNGAGSLGSVIQAVTWRSTAVATDVLAGLAAGAGASELAVATDPTVLAAREAAVATTFNALTVEEQTIYLGRAVTLDAAQLLPSGLLPDALPLPALPKVALPLPLPLPSLLPIVLPSVPLPLPSVPLPLPSILPSLPPLF